MESKGGKLNTRYKFTSPMSKQITPKINNHKTKFGHMPIALLNETVFPPSLLFAPIS
ncbi:MAG: hypothetical protein QXO71_10790 [Candidatus Jordarchaeaceae archaeon]